MAGRLSRSKDGLFVNYRLADDDVFRLGDIMCGRIAHLQHTGALSGAPD